MTGKISFNSTDTLKVKTPSILENSKNNSIEEYLKLSIITADIERRKRTTNSTEESSLHVKGFQIDYEEKSNQNSPRQLPQNTDCNCDDKKVPGQPKSQGKTQPGKSKPSKPEQQKQNTPIKSGKQSVNNNSQRSSGNFAPGNNGIVISGDIYAPVTIHNTEAKTPEAPSVEEQQETISVPSQEQKKQEIINKNKEDKKQEIINKNKENYTAAFADGKQVAKDLIGYTNTEEKENAIRLLMKQSKETIIGFISGFNQNDTVWLITNIKYGKGGLIDQIDNENGWTKSEKKVVFKKIISTVLAYANAAGYGNDSNYKNLLAILNDVKADKEIDTERADYLIKELISQGKTEASL